MKCLSQSAILRTVTWLALVLAVAVTADLVEDLIFEMSEAAAVDEKAQAEASDGTVPSPRLIDSTPLSHSFPLFLSQTAGAAPPPLVVAAAPPRD